jgi:two-component sensor histidine kinase
MGSTQRFSDETVLLAEFNHRLCNTLQVIAAMVAQCRRDTDGSATPVLLGHLQERLQALGALHRLLATAPPPEAFENHCRKLCILLVQAFGRGDVTPWVVIEDVDLSPEQSFRLPLLVVELVTNVLKHSLADQNGGTIFVDLRQRRDDIELTVSDTRTTPGPVFAPSTIVKTLAQSLEGEAFVTDAGGRVAGARIPSAARRSRCCGRSRSGLQSDAPLPHAPAVADAEIPRPGAWAVIESAGEGRCAAAPAGRPPECARGIELGEVQGRNRS